MKEVKERLIYIEEGSCNPAEFLKVGVSYPPFTKGSQARKIAKKLKLKNEEEFEAVFRRRK